MIVGLGNPGMDYAQTRHNVGFMVLDRLAEKLGVRFSQRGNAEVAEGRIGSEKIILMKPLTYMNLSGQAVVPVLRFYKLRPEDLLVVQDDLDMPFRMMKFRHAGSSGGQGGIKSITQLLGSEHFTRLKIGIDRPPPKFDVPRWVLSKFKPEEQPDLGQLVELGVQAASNWAEHGLDIAQQKFNGTDLRPKPPKKPREVLKIPMRVKMCGMTRVEDALLAEKLGADAIGLIFASFSKRYVTPEQARKISLSLSVLPSRVGVFVDAPLDQLLETAEVARLTAVQLHGNETPEYAKQVAEFYPVVRAFKVKDASLDLSGWQDFTVLLDGSEPGSGQAFDWSLLPSLKPPKRWWLAGGLGPQNVVAALEAVKNHLPVGVDAVTHLEASPGIKDPARMRAFMQNLRSRD
ncbi:aminoacyl-tRNA hydrolase [Deinococcus roseus]|uniref:Multifunctional fusion protein n=1 Tax=Deinococcus roseus TaxID=392414 RepID=A0ABQ2D198_9DEIO|nr:aminoacyl-tRNA hydrolase [Deinococcus roseus]GGJ41291.1 hypothetical protein GCM10008938_29170 [Deinococcus roseus]